MNCYHLLGNLKAGYTPKKAEIAILESVTSSLDLGADSPFTHIPNVTTSSAQSTAAENIFNIIRYVMITKNIFPYHCLFQYRVAPRLSVAETVYFDC